MMNSAGRSASAQHIWSWMEGTSLIRAGAFEHKCDDSLIENDDSSIENEDSSIEMMIIQ